MSKTRILLTTTSFQDTPGEHHKMLADTGWEVVTARGPLNEADTLALMGSFDGYICGDDAITRKVLEKARPKLKVLSKYGIGVDKIDVKSCTEFGIPLLFTPGVNHTTVAEHTFLLLLALQKHLLVLVDIAPGARRDFAFGVDHRTSGVSAGNVSVRNESHFHYSVFSILTIILFRPKILQLLRNNEFIILLRADDSPDTSSCRPDSAGNHLLGSSEISTVT